MASSDTSTLEIPKDFICPITGLLMWDPVIGSKGESYSRTALPDCKRMSNMALRRIIRKWVEDNADAPCLYREYPVYEVATGKQWAYEQTGVVRCRSWEYPKAQEGRSIIPLSRTTSTGHPCRGLAPTSTFSSTTAAVLDIPQQSGPRVAIIIMQHGEGSPTCTGIYSFEALGSPQQMATWAGISVPPGTRVVSFFNPPFGASLPVNIYGLQTIPDVMSIHYSEESSPKRARIN